MRVEDARGLARRARALIAALALAPGTGAALADPREPPVVEPVIVIGATPLSGAALDAAKAPFAVRSLSAEEVEDSGATGVADALLTRVGAINLGDDLNDPFQPDVLYRGFQASPVLGAPQGLAVYQSGVRINEAFGDTVNWDLIAPNAIARVDLVGSNPVYGLNALGGALALATKTGFDHPGGEAEASGGSFGERAFQVAYGAHGARWGAFMAVRALDREGWRILSPDRLRQLFGDVSYRAGAVKLDLSYTGADNLLRGPGAAPVQELELDRRLIFTSPQSNANRLNFLVLNASIAPAGALSLQANLFVRDFRQAVANGNATEYRACEPPGPPGELCQGDAVTSLAQASGQPIPDLSQGGSVPIGENDRATVSALTVGGAIQATSTARLFGRPNQATIGGEASDARINYAAPAEVGVIDRRLVVQPSGFFVDTPEGTAFPATPVMLNARQTDAGAFLTDTLDLAHGLSLTASGRFNVVRIALRDRLGARLTGTSDYRRFNPAVGVAWRLGPGLILYGGYAEGSRAPTASEIECSSPQAPCLLPSSLSADPPTLRQVVSRTVEFGARGGAPVWRGRLTYSVGAYRTAVSDDIYAVASSLSAGYFQNIAGTRRIGGEAELTYRDDRLTAYLDYAYVDATFQADLFLPSPSNPFRDANGAIHVRPGDRLPGIPKSRLKLGADVAVLPRLWLGGDLRVVGGQVYRGDESNQLAPIPGYAVVGFHARFALSKRARLEVRVENALDARYAAYGLLGDPTGVGAPGVPASSADPRFQSPATPIAVYGALRVTF